MIVVCDASPLYGLLILQQLPLLRKMYDQVIVPQQVWAELSALSRSWLDNASFAAATEGIQIAYASNQLLITVLLTDLDSGESEAIALAKEIGADWLLIDERKGRKLAMQHGLKVKGLIGVLLDAKDAGYIPAVKPLLLTIQKEIRFHIAAPIFKQALKDANEQ